MAESNNRHVLPKKAKDVAVGSPLGEHECIRVLPLDEPPKFARRAGLGPTTHGLKCYYEVAAGFSYEKRLVNVALSI